MATKKTATKKGATPSTSAKKAAATKAKAPKKSTAGASATKTKAPKAKAPKAAAAKKPAIKVSPTQREFLKKIDETSMPGYLPAKKAEEKTIEALLTRKLVKKGSKDKASGKFHYQATSAGKKLLSEPAPA